MCTITAIKDGKENEKAVKSSEPSKTTMNKTEEGEQNNGSCDSTECSFFSISLIVQILIFRALPRPV